MCMGAQMRSRTAGDLDLLLRCCAIELRKSDQHPGVRWRRSPPEFGRGAALAAGGGPRAARCAPAGDRSSRAVSLNLDGALAGVCAVTRCNASSALLGPQHVADARCWCSTTPAARCWLTRQRRRRVERTLRRWRAGRARLAPRSACFCTGSPSKSAAHRGLAAGRFAGQHRSRAGGLYVPAELRPRLQGHGQPRALRCRRRSTFPACAHAWRCGHRCLLSSACARSASTTSRRTASTTVIRWRWARPRSASGNWRAPIGRWRSGGVALAWLHLVPGDSRGAIASPTAAASSSSTDILSDRLAAQRHVRPGQSARHAVLGGGQDRHQQGHARQLVRRFLRPLYRRACGSGNFDGSAMWDASGVSGAAPVWLEIMNHLHASTPSQPPAAVPAAAGADARDSRAQPRGAARRVVPA